MKVASKYLFKEYKQPEDCDKHSRDYRDCVGQAQLKPKALVKCRREHLLLFEYCTAKKALENAQLKK